MVNNGARPVARLHVSLRLEYSARRRQDPGFPHGRTAWANFARHGTPKWPSYQADKPATRIFDSPVSTVVNDPDRETRLLIASAGKAKNKE